MAALKETFMRWLKRTSWAVGLLLLLLGNSARLTAQRARGFDDRQDAAVHRVLSECSWGGGKQQGRCGHGSCQQSNHNSGQPKSDGWLTGDTVYCYTRPYSGQHQLDLDFM